MRANGGRGRAVVVAMVLTAALASLAGAAPAFAKSPTGDFAVFSQCPRFNTPEPGKTGVVGCLYSETKSGEVTLNKQKVPITNTIILQGGTQINLTTGAEEFVGAINGETLSKTPQNVPGGLLGLVNCTEIKGEGFFEKGERAACKLIFEGPLTGVNATTELALPASSISISSENLINREGVALGLPVKIHLENVLLGPECYIGSSSHPIKWELTTGETHPEPPNTSIEGKVGETIFKDGFFFSETLNNTLVDNAWAAPEATGCGGIFSGLIDPIINKKIGLPSPDGQNTAILNGTLKQAVAAAVIASEK